MGTTIPPGSHIVTLTLRVKPAFTSRMRVIVHELAVSSRNDEGCLAFVAAESAGTPGFFLITSAWRDAESYENHRLSPYVRAFESQIAPQVLKESADIGVWRKIG
jgi:quinol monooxygenase YgiN